jgi:hypothetical protein
MPARTLAKSALNEATGCGSAFIKKKQIAKAKKMNKEIS